MAKVTAGLCIEDTEKAKLEVLAKNKGISLSKFLLELVESGLERISFKDDFDVLRNEINGRFLKQESEIEFVRNYTTVNTEVLNEMFQYLYRDNPDEFSKALEMVKKGIHKRKNDRKKNIGVQSF